VLAVHEGARMNRELAVQVLSDVKALKYEAFCQKYGQENPELLGPRARDEYSQMKIMVKMLDYLPKQKRELVIERMMKDPQWKKVSGLKR
jgi:hypothetical protein